MQYKIYDYDTIWLVVSFPKQYRLFFGPKYSSRNWAEKKKTQIFNFSTDNLDPLCTEFDIQYIYQFSLFRKYCLVMFGHYGNIRWKNDVLMKFAIIFGLRE